MSETRREFLKRSSLAAAAIAATPIGALGEAVAISPPQQSSSAFREVCLLALDAARSAGAAYADVRVVDSRTQVVATREHRVTRLSDIESVGVGVRVLVEGAWGFAAGPTVTRSDSQRLAQDAVRQARANARATGRPVELAAVEPYPNGAWHSPIRTDPFLVPVEDKIDLLLSANARALAVSGARFVSSSLLFVREQKVFGSTDGSLLEQTIYRSAPSMTVTAVAGDRSDFQSRASSEVPAMGLGFEHVVDADLPSRAEQWAEEAVAKLAARPVEPGRYDLVLEPANLSLTIHESIGHPTELDRALGFEADYAGTSFLAPPATVLGRLQYGPEFMNVLGDRTQRGALATVGWDDEGVPADSWPIIKDGVFVDYQTTREQAGWIAEFTGVTRSHGCSYADSWSSVPMQRMPNVSLLPGESQLDTDDLVAATDRGILIKGRGSYSIDQQRHNFQFGGQVFYEIRDGQVTGMLKDVAYQGRTLEFWNALDMLGGPRSYALGGTIADAKGQPSQVNAVSHGCPPALFRQISVINTA